jgi:hypothetical protein
MITSQAWLQWQRRDEFSYDNVYAPRESAENAGKGIASYDNRYGVCIK